MKQRIRLTESQLHNVIKESVKQILTELDPRTYASYAQKRKQQANELSRQYNDDWRAGKDLYKYGEHKYDPSFYKNKAQQGQQMAQMAFNNKYAQQGDYMPGGENYNVWTSPSDTRFITHREEINDGNGYRDAQIQDYINHPSYGMARQMNDPHPERDYVKGKGWYGQ